MISNEILGEHHHEELKLKNNKLERHYTIILKSPHYNNHNRSGVKIILQVPY